MARLDAGLTQGLMNPTYADKLGQAAGMLGGLGGKMRKTRQDKEKAQGMAGLTTEGLLAKQREAASTPAEAIAAGLAQDQFGQQQTARKKAEREDKQLQAEKLAGSQLSAMGVRHKALVKAGKTAEAAKLLTNMEEIAKGAMVQLSDYVEDVDSSSSNRYMNIGGGVVFDSKDGKFISNKTGEAVEPSTLDPKDLDAAYQKNKEAYTPASWALYSAEMGNSGDPVKAGKKLESNDPMKAEAANRLYMTSESNRLLSQADELLARVPTDALGRTGQFVFGALPMTEQGAVQDLVDTLKSNIAFDTLQQMRDMSKTGGALGQVSNIELNLLEKNVAALNPSSPDFPRRLKEVMNHYQHIQNIMQGPEGSIYFDVDEEGKQVYLNPVDDQIYYVETGIVKPGRSR
mgnify:CR=1 FL=1